MCSFSSFTPSHQYTFFTATYSTVRNRLLHQASLAYTDSRYIFFNSWHLKNIINDNFSTSSWSNKITKIINYSNRCDPNYNTLYLERCYPVTLFFFFFLQLLQYNLSHIFTCWLSVAFTACINVRCVLQLHFLQLWNWDSLNFGRCTLLYMLPRVRRQVAGRNTTRQSMTVTPHKAYS